jgi:hypothetical protein
LNVCTSQQSDPRLNDIDRLHLQVLSLLVVSFVPGIGG